MADDIDDPYWRLRPATATPTEEVCRCPKGIPVALCYRLGENPLCCMECHFEVPPERIGFSAKLAEDIASWSSVYGSLYRLWINSGEYEEWAAARLTDPLGQVNMEGREIVQKLSAFVQAYYFWFENTEAVDAGRLNVCPICGRPLEAFHGGRRRVCKPCRITA